MKMLEVSNKCDGCGLCTVSNQYLMENEDGNAIPVEGVYIKENDIDAVLEIVKLCPNGAISIVDKGNTNKTGKEAITDLVQSMKKKCEAIKLKEIGRKDVKSDANKCNIDIPWHYFRIHIVHMVKQKVQHKVYFKRSAIVQAFIDQQ